MPVFFSLHCDMVMAAMSMTLLLAGVMCMAISRENGIPRPMPSWRYLGLSLIILAVREWLGIFGLSVPDFFHFYTYLALFHAIAAVPILIAARTESPPRRPWQKLVHAAFAVTLLVLLALAARPLLSGPDAQPISRFLYTAVKVYLFLSLAFLTLCGMRSGTPPGRTFLNILITYSLYAAVSAWCNPPGTPAALHPADTGTEYIVAVGYLLRGALAIGLAIMLWNLYTKVLGALGAIRWWPLAFMFCLAALGLVFVQISTANYKRVVRNNLMVCAHNAAEAIPRDALRAAAAAPGSANQPNIADAVFGKVRNLEFFVGYSRVGTRVDALAADPDRGGATPIIDVASHPRGGLWATDPAPVRNLWQEVRRDGVLVHNLYTGSRRPALILGAIPGPDGEPAGAAVVSVSPADLAHDLFVFKRLALICLPIAFFVFLLLLSGQQRAWLASHSVSRAEALKLGALGNDLAGVMITKGDVIVDVNKRLCEMSGIPAERMIGGNVAATFVSLSENPARLQAEIEESLAGNRFVLFETRLRHPADRDIHAMVYARKLTEDPADDHHIWECVDISRQKEMENQLREARDSLQMIIESVPAAVFVKDPEGRYTLANRMFAESMGKQSPLDIVGKTTELVNPGAAAEANSQDKLCVERAGTPQVYEHAFEINGERRSFEVSKTVKRTGPDDANYIIVGSMHDYTELKQAGEAVKAERHFLFQLINTLPVIVCFIDRDRVIRLCDTDFCREAGVDAPEEIIGLPYDEVAPLGPGNPAEDWRILERGSGFSDVEFELTKDGRHRNFMLRRIAVSNSDGKIQGLLLAFWDITALNAANRAARNAERAKAAFLAGMSHELRTPMNGIVGMADLIIEHAATEPVQLLYAETIVKSAKTLQMVMDEVMDVATLDGESRRPSPARSPLILLPLVEEAAQIASCIVGAWGIELVLSYDFGLRPLYIGDAHGIRQIIVQLLTHCSRLVDDRRLLFTVAGDRDESGRETVAVRVDFKPAAGLGPAELERMFKNPAQPGDGDKPASGPGVYNDRIGLPLAWRLLRDMDGTLDITGDERGIQCRAGIPLESGPEENAGLAPPDLTGMAALLAFAEDAGARAVAQCLDYAGVKTTLVDNVDDILRSLRAARATERPYHLLLLDTHLVPTEKLGPFLHFLENDPDFGNPAVMLIVTVRNFQNASGLGGKQVKSLLLPPICPSELWLKTENIWNGSGDGGGAGEEKGTRRRSRRTTRIVGPENSHAEILLVEDNTVNQMVAMGILKQLGCNPTLAKNGEEAVNRIVSGERYDLILMDCMMPDMDGYEATGHIRLYEKATPGAQRNIIVALTANNVPGEMEKCLASGMDGYITKPITTEIVRDALLRHCPNLAAEEASLPAEGKKAHS